MQRDADENWMRLAIEIASQGRGWVEPNPMVGCVLVRDGSEIGRGWHQKFGGDHAEINAIRSAGDASRATAYVTLEPCCHQGKTGPCTNALIEANVGRVVSAMLDPFPAASGAGIRQLRDAGIVVEVGVLETEARRLNAPYLKRLQTGRPWVIAKWAMTLDGKIATRQSDSRWISGEASRAYVHALRGIVDAIIVGSRTAQRDDPTLTARPLGARIATRVVFDRQLNLSTQSRLVCTIDQAPLLVIADNPPRDRRERLETFGCEVFDVGLESTDCRITAALNELGRRGFTNVLLEGGGTLLGSFFDAGHIDEVIVFIAPKLFGGAAAISPLAGRGVARVADSLTLVEPQVVALDNDWCIRGRVSRKAIC